MTEACQGDFTYGETCEVCLRCCLDLLVTQQGLLHILSSFLGWELFKQLVVTSKEVDLAGKVTAHTILPLHGNLHACSDVSKPSYAEHSEVPEYQELVYFHEWIMLFVCGL